MSAFPYTTTSPPPTAGPLPVIERANINTPYSGGGGGGGGSVPPNLSLSTLTINPDNGQITLPNDVDANTGLVAYQDPTNTSTTTLGIDFVSGYADKFNSTNGVWSVLNNLGCANEYYGDFAAGRFAVLGNNGGTLVSVPVIDADESGQMSINAVSTINFSTPTLLLNGAPIGGGGAPPAAVSTISSFTNVSTINVGTPGVITIAGGLSVLDNLTTGNISTLAITSLTGGSVSIPDLAVSTMQTSGAIQVLSPLNVSTLVVSSINGAAPGGGSSATLSTLFNGNSTINCDNTQVLLSFNTTIGNTYQIQTQMSIQGRGGEEGTLNDDVILDLAGELYLNQVQGSFISTANAASRDLNIGTCGLWKATTNTQNLAISGTFSTQVNLNKVFLLDYGAI